MLFTGCSSWKFLHGAPSSSSDNTDNILTVYNIIVQVKWKFFLILFQNDVTTLEIHTATQHDLWRSATTLRVVSEILWRASQKVSRIPWHKIYLHLTHLIENNTVHHSSKNSANFLLVILGLVISLRCPHRYLSFLQKLMMLIPCRETRNFFSMSIPFELDSPHLNRRQINSDRHKGVWFDTHMEFGRENVHPYTPAALAPGHMLGTS